MKISIIYNQVRRQFKAWRYAIGFGLLFFSCDPCRNLDCLQEQDEGHFRVISASDGSDLLFGPNTKYERKNIKIYSLNGADTTFYRHERRKLLTGGNDSVLYVRFLPKHIVAFLQLSASDVDTLTLSYASRNTKCCGIITDITNFRYNNKLDIPGNTSVQELKK